MAIAYGEVSITLHYPNGTSVTLGVSSDTGIVRVRTKPLDFIGSDQSGGFTRDSTRKKQVSGIRFEFQESPNGATQVEIFTRDKLSDTPVSHGVFPISTDGFVRCRLPNRRYYEFELIDQNSTMRWSLTGIEIFGAPAGDRKV
jgi:hypothetical protein